MKRKMKLSLFTFGLMALLLAGCSGGTTAEEAENLPQGQSQQVMETETLLAGNPVTAVVPATDPPAATVYPPVFDPEALGDNRELASFSMTATHHRTEGGEVVVDTVDSLEYIREPFTLHWGLTDLTVIGNEIYERISAGQGWSYYTGPYQGDVLDWQAVDTPAALVSRLESAQFIGQEDFGGIPANHFTFDQSNFYITSPAQPENWDYVREEAQGEIYLAQEGNYLLYFHIIDRGTLYEPDRTVHYPSVQESTYELSLINQLLEIEVPADFDLDLDLGLPLPTGAALVSIVSYRDGFLPDYYDYTLPATLDEFLDFYQNMAPTNGFAFSRIGTVTNNVYCGSEDCVILKKGNQEVLLSYNPGTQTNFLTVQIDG